MDLARSPMAPGAFPMPALAGAYVRYRNPHRRTIGRHQVASYDCAWREAAGRLGASCERLGDGTSEIARGGTCRVRPRGDGACRRAPGAVNTPPNCYFHHHKRDGAFPVAIAVLEHPLCDDPRPGRAALAGDEARLEEENRP